MREAESALDPRSESTGRKSPWVAAALWACAIPMAAASLALTLRGRTSRALLTVAIALGLVVLYAGAHLALIELGGEVVVLHKWTSDEETRRTRLWIVDDAERAWFHHGTSESAWIRRLEHAPVVTVERGGVSQSYRARPDRDHHALVHRLLREKYGFADWWVRFVTGTAEKCPALPVRLERAES